MQVLEHQGLAHRLAARQKRLGGEYDDFLQTALLAMFKCFARAGFDPAKGRISTYLSAAIWREHQMALNKGGRTLTYSMHSSLCVPMERRAPFPDSVRFPDPQNAAMESESHAMVHWALARLNKHERWLLTTVYGIGRPQRRLDARDRYRVQRARARFAKKLTEWRSSPLPKRKAARCGIFSGPASWSSCSR